MHSMSYLGDKVAVVVLRYEPEKPVYYHMGDSKGKKLNTYSKQVVPSL